MGKRIDRKLDTPLNLILKGGAAVRLNAKMVLLESRQKELRAFLDGADDPPPLLHPNMGHHYRVQVKELCEALQENSEAKRLAAADKKNPDVLAEVGVLAGLLSPGLLVAGTRADLDLRRSQFEAVAGARNGLNLLASQVEVVAGARADLDLLFRAAA